MDKESMVYVKGFFVCSTEVEQILRAAGCDLLRKRDDFAAFDSCWVPQEAWALLRRIPGDPSTYGRVVMRA